MRRIAPWPISILGMTEHIIGDCVGYGENSDEDSINLACRLWCTNGAAGFPLPLRVWWLFLHLHHNVAYFVRVRWIVEGAKDVVEGWSQWSQAVASSIVCFFMLFVEAPGVGGRCLNCSSDDNSSIILITTTYVFCNSNTLWYLQIL